MATGVVESAISGGEVCSEYIQERCMNFLAID
jgi:hypothetical protein